MTTANNVVVLGNLPLDDLFQLYEDVSAEMNRAQPQRTDGDEN